MLHLAGFEGPQEMLQFEDGQSNPTFLLSTQDKQYAASKTDEFTSMERLMEYLPSNVPPDETRCIVHGGYRMGNILAHPTAPKIATSLDRELSTLGHPLGDLGYSCMSYHHGIGGSISLEGLTGPTTDIPTEEELLAVAENCRLTGRNSISNWNFYLAFSFFRLSSILQGVYKRGIIGNASSSEALEKRCMAREIADIAWTLLD